MDIEQRFHDVVQSFWIARDSQKKKQEQGGKIDAGTRGSVTGGTQMGALEVLVVDILIECGLNQLDIRTRTALQLSGYFRSEKKWDLLVVSEGQLITAIEFKSQVGPSFGNNFNNRVEEALGSATDIWTAYREGRFGLGPHPFLGYFFLLEDCDKVQRPVRNAQPYFRVDPIFEDASYSKRYEVLCQRLILERLYDAACLTLATNSLPSKIHHPSDDLSFNRFVAELKACAYRFIQSKGISV